jgi:manganese/iron transport system ATP-binding protein
MIGVAVNNVSVSYNNGHCAVSNASFTLPMGSITALVGINGSGKSTMFKAIMGFISLSQGNVEILGLSVKQALKQNLVAYVPQSEEIDWQFPILVEDVVMMGRYGHMNMFRQAKTKDYQQVDSALSRVNMTEYRHRQINELSGGQKKRVFLARALAQESQIVLLDEPFTGIDVQTEEQIMSLLRDLRAEGKVILVSTHNLGSVPEFCNRTVLIKQTILAQGDTKQVFTHENLQKAFGGVLRHFVLAGETLHKDDDDRQVTILSDDERPVVLYGDQNNTKLSRQVDTTPEAVK